MTKVHLSIILPVCALLLAACAGGASPPPATQEVSDASVLYAENFDDGESCFDPEELAFAALSIEEGELIMEVTDSGKLFWSTCEEVLLDNFTFEMDVYDDTSAGGFHFFGLQFRKDPVEGGSNQYYLVRFGLGEGPSTASCAGLASDSAWIANLTASPSGDSCWVDLPERIEPGQWNHFEITADGPVLTYKVNDVFVASVDDPRLTQGTIALFAGTHSGDSARFKIDNISITELGD